MFSGKRASTGIVRANSAASLDTPGANAAAAVNGSGLGGAVAPSSVSSASALTASPSKGSLRALTTKGSGSKKLSRSSSTDLGTSESASATSADATANAIELLASRVARAEMVLDKHDERLLSANNAVAGMVKSRMAELVEQHSQRLLTAFSDLDMLKLEAVELTSSLRQQLAQLQRQKAVLEDLLVKGPNVMGFPPSGSVKLRVGEHVFHSSIATLTRDPGSMLAAMFSGKFTLHKDEDGCYFIDRDGALFHVILSFLRTSRLPLEPMTDAARDQLLIECEFYGLAQLKDLLKQAKLAQLGREEEAYERNTMLNIQSIATSNFVQSVIASLAEVTHMAFRQMASDAEAGLPETLLVFNAGQMYHDFFVAADGVTRKALHIFLELLRQEGAQCTLLSPTPTSHNVVIRCSLLRSEKDICAEVLRNFKKMRGFGKTAH